jgi:amino acid transporter
MMLLALKRLLVGTPLASTRERHERLSIPLALAVFASDALSSTAYATEEILLALSTTAYAALSNLISLPIAMAIVTLMVIVVISYRQVIQTYPQGGGSYEVSRANLGPTVSQIGGSALLIDYVLTVAVSVSAGVAALTSTGLVGNDAKVPLAMLFIALITLVNLRGVKETGRVLVFPAYLFIGTMFALLGWGGWQLLQAGAFSSLANPMALVHHAQASGALSPTAGVASMAMVLAMLHAFSHGCAALTGIEVIANGVKAFKEPTSHNANKTLVLMAAVLATIFLGMTLLAFGFGVGYSHHDTVVSQLGKAVFGDGSPLYFLLQFITMVILVFAANTCFSGFPRLASILADDGYLPRQLMSLGDRLVFSNGILILGVLSALLVAAFGANTHAIIPLYAVGVFLSFSLAQFGMVAHHKRHQQPGWRRGLAINLFGALITSIVTLILLIEKFTTGAWMILVALPLLVWLFRSVEAHYRTIAKQMVLPSLADYQPKAIDHTVLVLVSSLNRGTLPALEYARTISDRVEAVHVEINPAATRNLANAWEDWGGGVPLTILKSPYRSINQPLMDYISEVEARYEHDLVTIIVPEFVTKRFWHNLLHNQTSLLLKTLLRFKRGKVVTSVRYYLDE